MLNKNCVFINSVILILILPSVPNGNHFEVSAEWEYVQPYQEYFMEHIVTGKDAAIAFKKNRYRLLNGSTEPWCHSINCTQKVIKYCLSSQMLDDHCCCDSRHGKEQLPWLPHSCYVGEHCRPIVGSCILYTDWRQCCCDKIIAKKWDKIFSSSARIDVNLYLFLCLTLATTLQIYVSLTLEVLCT